LSFLVNHGKLLVVGSFQKADECSARDTLNVGEQSG